MTTTFLTVKFALSKFYCRSIPPSKPQHFVFIVSSPSLSLVTRIAATSNRKSLATAIATQKNHCDSENTSDTAISLRFLREKLATSKLRLAIASNL